MCMAIIINLSISFQVILLANVKPLKIPALLLMENLLTRNAPAMAHANVENASVKRLQRDNTLDNFVKNAR